MAETTAETAAETAADTAADRAKAAIRAVLDAEPDYVVDLCQRLVRIPSVNPKYPAGNDGWDIAGREAEVQDVIEGELAPYGLSFRRWDALPGRPNLVARTEAGDPAKSLILCGHIDVMPVGDPGEWSADPFGAVIRDGRMLGRGAVDMKAGVAACVAALRAVRKAGVTLDGQLALHAVVDEEAGGAGAKAAVAAGELAAAAIIAEPSNGDIHVCQGALHWLRVTIRGRQGHSAHRFTGYWPQPEAKKTGAEPVSAADLATRFLVALRDYEAAVTRAVGHPLMAPGVNQFNVGTVHIGAGMGPDGLPQIMNNPGIVPDVAVIDIDMKTMPQESTEEVRAAFEAFVAGFCASDPWFKAHPIAVEWDLYGLYFPPMDTDPEHPLVRSITATRAAMGLGDTALVGSLGVTDGAHYAAGGVAALRYGPTGGGGHGADEWVDVESIRRTTRIFAEAVIDFCGVKDE
ncbi:M20 family metallopeptidase [Pseudooceanicola sp. 502str34]